MPKTKLIRRKNLENRFVEFSPRDTNSSEFRVDWENFIIYGVKLGDFNSRNNHKYLRETVDDIVRISHRLPVHTAPHGTDDPNDTNGQILNPRLREDGKPIGDWHLEKEDPKSRKWLESAERFPGNVALSLDAEMKNVESEIGERGVKVIKKINKIDHFNLVTYGGTNLSLSESYRRKGKSKMPTKTTTKKRFTESARNGGKLIERYTDLPSSVKRFIESVVADAEDIESSVATLTKERDEFQTKYEESKGQLDRINRREQIASQWETLTKPFDQKLIKDAKLDLSADDLDKFVEMEASEVSIELATRISKLGERIQESAKKGSRLTESHQTAPSGLGESEEDDYFDFKTENDPFVSMLTRN